MAKLVMRISDGVIFEVRDDFKLGNDFKEVNKDEQKETRDDVTPAASKIKTDRR